MTTTISPSLQLFVEQQPQCMKVLRQLSSMDWYATGGWSSFIGLYHAGIYMQVAKGNWYNHGLDGIHFEFGLTQEALAAKTLAIDLHIGHKNLFDREQFNALPLIEWRRSQTAGGRKAFVSQELTCQSA